MSKKNTLPIKWLLGILIILMAVAYWTTQQTQSKNQGILPVASNVSSQNNFFQFLASLIGMGNNIPDQNELMPTPGHVPSSGGVSPSTPANETASNVKAPPPTGPIAGQGTNTAQGKNNTGNNTENNPGDLLEANADQGIGNLSELNAENNLEMNAENNPATNAETNADQETGNIAENNPELNAENNQENDLENNPENNSESNMESNVESNAESNMGSNAEINAENNPGGNSGNLGNAPGCAPGCYAGCNPACATGCVPGCSAINTPPPNLLNLPTINPIPSDNAVSQSIAQQNQQSDALATLLATSQALVLPVRQQAQASKYRTINSQDIPAVSTNQAPADTVAKIKSNQAMVSH
jgi:hypothetical protein